MANPKVRPVQDGIRLRETPNDGRAIGVVGRQDILDSLESNIETRRKLGSSSEWLLVRTSDGTSGYVATQSLTVVSIPDDPPRKVRCLSGGLRIRPTPEATGDVLGVLVLNEIVESLESDGETERKLGVLGQWLRIRDEDGVTGYVAAWFMGAPGTAPAPTAPARPSTPAAPPAPSLPSTSPTVYVRPKEDGLRIRELPRDGRPIGQASLSTVLESLEPRADTLAKIGAQNQWLHVRTQAGKEGYVAAWLVVEAEPPTRVAQPGAGAANIVGISLDEFHPLGMPDPQRFRGAGWIRFRYNVSMGRGSQDIQAAYDLYRPQAERYARAGFQVIFCLTHQTYGEGRPEFWPWQAMNDDKWRRFTDRFTDMANRIAAQYAGQDLVHAWQVWDKQDLPMGTPDAVPMLPRHYMALLGRSVQALRAADSGTPIITGSHASGASPGSNYARATLAGLPATLLPDGIACTPYGPGQGALARYTNFDDIRETLNAYLALLPDRPLWLTDWGVLDPDGDTTDEMSNYAAPFIDAIMREYAGRVAGLLWSPWAMGMRDLSGAMQPDTQPLQPLYDRFLSVRG